MTPEQIAQWGREASLPFCHLSHPKALMRFAKLVHNAALQDAADQCRSSKLPNAGVFAAIVELEMV